MAVVPIQAKKQYWRYMPLLGIPCFLLLYVIATLFYPGGSQADHNAAGFSWLHNYWCNLLNHKAINGQDNPAQPIAITAMVVLCISLTVFWYCFPSFTTAKKVPQQVVRYSGTLAMVAASSLGVLEHDWVTNIASLLGVIAVIGTLVILKKERWQFLFGYGLVNVLLVGINNLFYYNAHLIYYLPLIQKITFASFLLWIWLMVYYVRR
jgi:hypothetical protein